MFWMLAAEHLVACGLSEPFLLEVIIFELECSFESFADDMYLIYKEGLNSQFLSRNKITIVTQI